MKLPGFKRVLEGFVRFYNPNSFLGHSKGRFP